MPARRHVRRPVYLDRSYTPAERAADLVSRMSLAEKAQEMNSSQAPAHPASRDRRLGLVERVQPRRERLDHHSTGNATTLTNTTSYPSDLSMGSTWDPELVYREAP